MNTAHPVARTSALTVVVTGATTGATPQATIAATDDAATATAKCAASAAFHLRFESLFNAGRGMAFPCDARGCVELDALSEPARRNYFYARAVVGREFATPAVVRGGPVLTA